jgi:O-antigen ligase
MSTGAMTELAAPMPLPGAPSLRRVLGACAAGLVLLPLSAGLAYALAGLNVPFALALAGGIGLIALLLLAIRNYELTVAIGLLLMGVVRFEPAPPDIVFAVVMIVAALTGRFHVRRVPLLLRWVIASLLTINLLSMIDAVSATEATRFLLITVYLAIFAMWLIGYVDRPSRARLVIVTWLAIGLLSAVLSVLALYMPLPGREVILGNVDNAERASGFFKDPNVFGPFLVPIALILLEQRLVPKVPRLLHMRAATSWLALFALTLGVLFSYSRAAWANFAIGVVIMLAALSLRRRGASRALRALVLLVFVAGVTVVVLSATGSIGFFEHRAQVQGYDTQRFAAQSFGWQLGWTHPVGVGPGQFVYYSPTIATHSTFVRVFAEQGFIGLAVLIVLLLSTLVLALRNVVVGANTWGIGSTALLGAWCGVILNSVVVDTLHWRHLWVLVALIWAVAARSYAQAPDRGGGSRRVAARRPRRRVRERAFAPPTIVQPQATSAPWT